MKRFLIISGIVLAISVVGFLILQPEPPFGRETNETTLTNLQTKYDQAPEIKNKYQLDRGALVKTNIKNAELTRNGEVKDKIEVVIGNRIDPELMGATDVSFEPTIELTRWDEVSFKIIPDLSDVDLKDRQVSFDKEKILFETPKINYEMYEYDEGYKYIWYLKEKPLSNKVEFSINTKGLDFWYQPPLTQEYQNGYSEEFRKEIVVTETQVKDLDGNVLVDRPENVVGSYAVYHKTKGGMNDINGMEYKAGKAFHIYRPKIIDATGKETWGILNIDVEQGLYTVEIPQEFLDKAVYPIRSNDDFGYTTEGEGYERVNGIIFGSVFTGGVGTVDSITAFMYLYFWDGSLHKLKYALYKHSDSTKVCESEEYNTSIAENVNVEKTLNVSGSPSITAIDYVIVAWGYSYEADRHANIRYDSGGTDQGHQQSLAYGDWPSTASFAHNDNKYSIYATYTPSAPPAADEDPPIIIITD